MILYCACEMSSRSGDIDCFHKQCSFSTTTPVCITQNWSRISSPTWNRSSSLITIFTGSGIKWQPSVSPPQKRFKAKRFSTQEKLIQWVNLNSKQWRGGEDFCTGIEKLINHSVLEVPRSKRWLCKEIVWNVTYLIEFFWQFLVVLSSRKKICVMIYGMPFCNSLRKHF